MEIEGSLLACGTVLGLSSNSGVQQEPISFLENLKETLQEFTNLDLDSYEGQAILKDKFLSQYSSDKVTTATAAGP